MYIPENIAMLITSNDNGEILYYSYFVKHRETVKEIKTSKPIIFEKGDGLVILDNAGYYAGLFTTNKGQVKTNLSILLYGYKVSRKNGDNLDYRKENCEPFHMGKYNREKRRYRNKVGAVGIRVTVSGLYYWIIHYDKKAYYSKERFPDKGKCIAARNKALKMSKEDMFKKCSFKSKNPA